MRPHELQQPAAKQTQERARKFVQEHIQPHAAQWEQERTFPKEVLKQLAQQQLLGLSLPKNAGGQGAGLWHEVAFAEELARSDTLGLTLSVLAHTNMAAPLLNALANEEQRERVLAPALRGEHWLALAATEPQAGSDLSSVQAVVKNGLLSGKKKYITNATAAAYHIVLAKSSGGKQSLQLLIADTSLDSVQAERLVTTGLRTADTAEVSYDNHPVTPDDILGRDGKGFYYLLKGLQRERLIGAVALNSLSRYVLEKTTSHLRSTHRFGSSLSKKQVIRHTLSELYARLAAAEQLAFASVRNYERDEPADTEITACKILSYELAQEIITYCTHLHGGESFLEDHWLAGPHRDMQAFTLAAGTSEVMRELLAGLLQL